MNGSEQFSKSEWKQERTQAAIRRRHLVTAVWIGGAILVVILALGGGVWWSYRWQRNAPGPSYTDIGQEHIPLSTDPPRPYNSNPPSSGAHFSSPANWEVYDYEVNDKIFIHNLEHGGIWIAYLPTIPSKAIEDLKGIVNEFGGSKLIMAPRAANDSDIAVAAWTRVHKINLVGGDITEEELNQIRAFYRAFKNKGPEFVPDTMPGVDPKTVQ